MRITRTGRFTVAITRQCSSCRNETSDRWPTHSGGLCPDCKSTASTIEHLAGIHPRD